MKLKDLINDRSKWTKGKFARDKDSKECLINSPNAVKFCIIGGLTKCYCFDAEGNRFARLTRENPYFMKLSAAIKQLHPHITCGESSFNDLSTWDEVKAVLELADV